MKRFVTASQKTREPERPGARKPGSQKTRQPENPAARKPGSQKTRQPERPAARKPGSQKTLSLNAWLAHCELSFHAKPGVRLTREARVKNEDIHACLHSQAVTRISDFIGVGHRKISKARQEGPPYPAWAVAVPNKIPGTERIDGFVGCD